MTEQKIAEIETILAARKATGFRAAGPANPESDWATIQLTAMVAEVKRLQAVNATENTVGIIKDTARHCAEIAFQAISRKFGLDAIQEICQRKEHMQTAWDELVAAFGAYDAAREGTDG